MARPIPLNPLHVYLLSDATGETVEHVARAALSQFPSLKAEQHVWPLLRNQAQIDKVLRAVQKRRGLVFSTFADLPLQNYLREACAQADLPFIAVLDPIIARLADYIGIKPEALPGRQHRLDAEYFERMQAMDFMLHHDDGQALDDLANSEVILVGVSRTSKTPTCLYLANRGIKAANIPLIAGQEPPENLLDIARRKGASAPLIVGLVKDPVRLSQVRLNRITQLGLEKESSYSDLESVRGEMQAARKLFAHYDWPTIDVTNRSIEETAATIMQLLAKEHAGNGNNGA
ncbi:MAG: pyruvate, water dikinase regulatory protein [Dongiaceae bacterium]